MGRTYHFKWESGYPRGTAWVCYGLKSAAGTRVHVHRVLGTSTYEVKWPTGAVQKFPSKAAAYAKVEAFMEIVWSKGAAAALAAEKIPKPRRAPKPKEQTLFDALHMARLARLADEDESPEDRAIALDKWAKRVDRREREKYRDLEQVGQMGLFTRKNPRVYHGTARVYPLNEGRPVTGIFGPGFYFTTNIEHAVGYAKSDARNHEKPEPGVFICDVELRHPLLFHTYDFPSDMGTSQADYDRWVRTVALPKAQRAKIARFVGEFGRPLERGMTTTKAIEGLEALGYDGIIVHLGRDGVICSPTGPTSRGESYYIVFDPKTCSLIDRMPV